MHKEPASFSARLLHRVHHIRALYRMLIGVGVALLASVFLAALRMEAMTRIMLGWDIFCIPMLTLIFINFFTVQPQQIRAVARTQDGSRGVVFGIIILACLTSLVAVLDLLGNKKGWLLPRGAEAAIYLSGVVLSWFLLHVIFTLRYAHTFYGDHPGHPDQDAGGLNIPGDAIPGYWDFAYFSFVIGMTFQVSDIAITSPHIRKWVLLHGLLSFLFNTVIVALTINEVVNLRS